MQINLHKFGKSTLLNNFWRFYHIKIIMYSKWKFCGRLSEDRESETFFVAPHGDHIGRTWDSHISRSLALFHPPLPVYPSKSACSSFGRI